jgi:penicillin amidase/acyl-homoserine-lactone acylase
MKRYFLLTLVCLSIAIAALALCNQFTQPSIAAPSQSALELKQQVTIYRDSYGIPHIHGATDAAAAFGLAFAHSEDDFPIIQGSLVAAKGQLSRLTLSKLAGANDFLVGLLDVKKRSERQFQQLPAHFQAYLNAYAEGLNYYAWLHPEEADARFFPARGIDVLAGFTHKLPLMMGIGNVLQNLLSFSEEQLQVGQPLEKHFDFQQTMPDWFTAQVAGSNTHAVDKKRSTDQVTRLNINSHQPWEGPVAWYEAHIISDQGLNMIGSTFPGAPMILHGHNQTLGWAHTVNRPDFIDVYKLTVRNKPALEYQLDGKWLPLSQHKAPITLDLTLFGWRLFEWTLNKSFYRSQHGPVLEVNGHYYAIRLPGREAHGKAAWQWFSMNKAKSFDQWQQAMRLQHVSMMNTVYADAENIYYLYNANLPQRPNTAGIDWRTILPGDRSELIWQQFMPFDELPQVLNPESGFVMNTNTTPFITTDGKGNPKPQDYADHYGIEKIINNRGLRSHETFGKDLSISREEFLRYKFDHQYSQHSSLYLELLNPLLSEHNANNTTEEKALALLRNWDGVMSRDSKAASLVRLIHEPWHRARTFKSVHEPIPTPSTLLTNAIDMLLTNFGTIDVPLGQLQKLKRGSTVLGIDGGVDTLYSVHTKFDGKHQVGTAGDSYVLIAEFSSDQVSGVKVESWALHQYGNVNRPNSPHYDDQTKLFQERELRKSLFTLADVKDQAVISYHPGDNQ